MATNTPIVLVKAPASVEKESTTPVLLWKDIDTHLSKRGGLKDDEYVGKDKKGNFVVKRYSAWQTKHFNKRERKRAEKATQLAADEKIFQDMPPTIVSTISIGGGIPPSKMEDVELAACGVKWPLNKTPSLREKITHKIQSVSSKTINFITESVIRSMKKNLGSVELINKQKNKTVRAQFKLSKFGKVVKVPTIHETGKIKPIDCFLHKELFCWLEKLISVTNQTRMVSESEIGPGSSGYVLAPHTLKMKLGRCKGGVFIVRGRSNGVLIDARSKLNKSTWGYMEHYSQSPGEAFWTGFNRTFIANKPTQIDHTCTSDLDVTMCGDVAALVCQTLFPCGRITCFKCLTNYSKLSDQEMRDLLISKVRSNETLIAQQYPVFKHVTSFLRGYGNYLDSVNTNFEAYSDIAKMFSSQNEAPYSHINVINSIIIKGHLATPDEWYKATESLREVSRWLKNRAETLKHGQISTFRNKIAGKAHINPTLMCDNQLDKNGNFMWGERGYHSKRFFSNYFEVIDPIQGYDKYVNRQFPNGSRQLAIGNLILSTNFESLRAQLKGVPVKKCLVGKACTSLHGGKFVYPCCCVTFEDGVAMESRMITPTKNHLIVGNSGDSKYVDLPPEINENMYIAKPGYCYLNIFLAMLVNVDEKEAKNFTKMVRDVIVEKLGTWPSMLDVATACHMLRTFHPGSESAEIPRILVDHNTKTMHVIDSYGSINTGYHILKANTVSQLILFASDSLDSEMKHYTVGGLPASTQVETNLVKSLIQGVYRPHLMRELVSDEPYILILSVLSPAVLKALFRSGALEFAINHWASKDVSVVSALTTLTVLAKKVTAARLLQDQFQAINQHSDLLYRNVVDGFKTHITYPIVVEMLNRLRNQRISDASLVTAGFSNYTTEVQEIIEKNFVRELSHSWEDLPFHAKFSQRWHWLKQRFSCGDCFEEKEFIGTTATLRRLCTSRLTLTGNWASNVAKRGTRKLQNTCYHAVGKMTCGMLGLTKRMLPDVFKMINTLVAVSLLLSITEKIISITNQRNSEKLKLQEQVQTLEYQLLLDELNKQERERGTRPTEEEFIANLEDNKNFLLLSIHSKHAKIRDEDIHDVQHQSRNANLAHFERIIAFISLVLMMFDAEKSDCVYKILSKLKGLINTTEQGVYHQSLDDIETTLDEKKLTIDFELDGQTNQMPAHCDTTFSEWWKNTLENGNVVPHYRTEGKFMEFTRSTAAQVANEIAHSTECDFLIRGAVGSGKSTGLPFHLHKKGSVLMLEPTRPLAENVCKQLRLDPFFLNPTLRMRGLNSFGSSAITVMTSGFALHFMANNPSTINDYKFIIIDECHVNDSSAMAFFCLLKEYAYQGKVLKVSATPPGREVEFTTQFPVSIACEDAISFQTFATNLGTGANSDVLTKGHNILVYVASYNEVDTLSKLLTDKTYRVTKIDGRTMKLGGVEIQTFGCKEKPHFIVATNIIENGVTLDIDVVVDFGTKVCASLDSDNRLIRYNKVAISYGERIQRLGRVGRNKQGHALRIGHTEKGLAEIPGVVATEAAFICFTYGLPVMTNNVSTSLLSSCTVRQARTMQQFELSPFFMSHLVRFDGSMHPLVHEIVRKYKLRDSEVILRKQAIPNRGITDWLTLGSYRLMGVRIEGEADSKIPFYVKDVPDKLYNDLWHVVKHHKNDAGFGQLSSVNACKIAYTLQTDIHAIPRTVKIIDGLLALEREKQAHFSNLAVASCTSSVFSLANVANAIKAKYASNHTGENIETLEKAKAQLLEFLNLGIDSTSARSLTKFGILESVHHQSSDSMSEFLQLKGKWNKRVITQDIFILIGVVAGGSWMMYEYLKGKISEPVLFQGRSKRQNQKLKYRDARDKKIGREVYGDDGTLEHFFGDAYTKKGKVKGKTHGMGSKSRRFINMYGYDPTDYSFVRFVDPLTGATLDENPIMDINLVQEHFSNVRGKHLEEDLLDPQRLYSAPGIEAYYVKNMATKALKVDLTPHNPLKHCYKNNTISGFPERVGELRQTGPPVTIDPTEVPKENMAGRFDEVEFESTALYKGLRDYNPIASTICQLTNNSDGYTQTLYGIGYGGLIITNQHLFKRNNGELVVKSHHGEFICKNTTQLKLFPCKERDVIIIRMPKDFPPFPQRLKFRQPKKGERVCLVGSNFQQKSVSSTVSEVSTTEPRTGSHFWKHWITTKDGMCGLPIVSTTDGCILGVHSLANTMQMNNYYASFPEDFMETYLQNRENDAWVRGWCYNAQNIAWGPLELQESQPGGMFKISKLVSDLAAETVRVQSTEIQWMRDALSGNLKAVAHCPGKLVTKHAVQGKCQLFELYLLTHPEAKAFFEPLMGSYQKSRLNREAYIKDIMKYATPIVVGEVNTDIFNRALLQLTSDFARWGFEECVYVTDTDDIFRALNMKAAVGALYSGKKRDYFKDYSEEDKDQILRESCFRLFSGKLGVWNGSLKAELRPLEKVEANKTRTFTAAPLDTLLGGKVCVDDFNNQFYALNLKCPWSVGMTKFHQGWNTLLNGLPDGWVYCDADGSQFDSSLSPYLINAVLTLRLSFMEDWVIGREMLKNLYTEIVYTPIATPDGTVVKKFKGNNSGQPSTVVDNTLMVILAMKYALLSEGIEEDDHDNMCRYFVNGDDLLIAIEPKYEHILNTFADHFRNLGLKYDFSTRTRNKSDLWFMSHMGMSRDGVFIPKLERERIVSILEWNRSKEPVHRLEAICASMIEAWGYDDLVHEIRKFYSWVLEQAPYNALAAEGKAPYIAETALRKLYMDVDPTETELEKYIQALNDIEVDESLSVYHQADEKLNAGVSTLPRGDRRPGKENMPSDQQVQEEARMKETPPSTERLNIGGEQPGTQGPGTMVTRPDKDINVGTTGVVSAPRLTGMVAKMRVPKVKGKHAMHMGHLMTYNPVQTDLSNARSTQRQFEQWFEGVRNEYGVTEEQMTIIANGLMVWCIENGTSPNINGVWTMMDGEEQVEYPLRPVMDHAAPTFRQIMAHFSDVAEAYIEKRNYHGNYMPRWGRQRNIRDRSLARYCFDFYEVTTSTPIRAVEAHNQMKAAALRGETNRLFGLDGKVTTQEENTERHTAEDVNPNLHTLLGMRGVQ
uniref:Genome polyprotein n=3 Tax=Malva vein clearing virus TaxID=565624 RepID=A0A6C0SLR8_9POTV|nr:polyprotein [Malva vein clearing virus]